MFPRTLKAVALLAVLNSTVVLAGPHERHTHLLHKRQDSSSPLPTTSPATTSPAVEAAVPATSPAASPTTTTTVAAASAVNTPPTTTNNASSSQVQAPVASAASSSLAPTATVNFQTSTGQPTVPVSSYSVGATPPISGAPGLPTPFVFNVADWPTQDRVPDTTSEEVQAWMKELDGVSIPNINPTVDGTCAGDPAAAADSANRGWWTCTGTTRDTDITTCPTKDTWGVSFDDGPGAYTSTLLNYLKEKDISATFFVVGSRVIERPDVLIEEYMQGHEISVHTWSHSKPLTSLTNEQIVAELGWTRKAIQKVLGVTPTTMRPPWGDIDDRVRAISLAMGLIPIIWTRTPSGVVFDTNDWKVAGGTVTVPDSLATFQGILGNATTLDTGFIVLQHDIHEITVDMAIGSTLSSALSHNPPFQLESIGQCLGFPPTDLYRETTQNKTFPYPTKQGGIDVDGDNSVDSATGSGATSKSSGSDVVLHPTPLFATAIVVVGVAVIMLELL